MAREQGPLFLGFPISPIRLARRCCACAGASPPPLLLPLPPSLSPVQRQRLRPCFPCCPCLAASPSISPSPSLLPCCRRCCACILTLYIYEFFLRISLVNGDIWAVAIENAIGRLLNAFIVTNHKDSLLLRQCAKEANYQHLQIIIYDFDRPKLNIPRHMLPQTDHPTVLSVLRTNNPTIVNVLVDQVPLFLLVLFLSAMLPNESGSLIKGYT
ncbi:hypothetical protein ACLOJK_003523 [Asimina triloba]